MASKSPSWNSVYQSRSRSRSKSPSSKARSRSKSLSKSRSRSEEPWLHDFHNFEQVKRVNTPWALFFFFMKDIQNAITSEILIKHEGQVNNVTNKLLDEIVMEVANVFYEYIILDRSFIPAERYNAFDHGSEEESNSYITNKCYDFLEYNKEKLKRNAEMKGRYTASDVLEFAIDSKANYFIATERSQLNSGILQMFSRAIEAKLK